MMKLGSRTELPWGVFAVTVAGAFMVALDLSIVNVAFPSITRSFPHVATTTPPWALSAYSVVTESVVGGPFPDLIGIGLISAAVASVALASTQGGHWGWTSSRVLGAFALAALLAPLAIRRSATHAAPAIDLKVFETRSVA